MKIEKIRMHTFRHMQDIEVRFGKRLTAISGQNGTGKSTILGLVGQIFDYKGKERTKNNLPFATKYSEIFRFCPIHDKKSNHEYEAILIDNDGNQITRDAKSRLATETVKTSEGTTKRERFRIDIGDRNKPGVGAIDFPVFYLGLKRLFPLAQEKEDSIRVKELKLNDSEKRFYSKYSREILISLDRSIKPQDIQSPNKEFLAIETIAYSNLGNSAGQDNLGQILTAILSFKELKEKKQGQYLGGILLIDEIDATLYAGSQINLLKKLYKFAMDYDLQIIFTTHSLEILELLKEKADWETEINFFEVLDKKVRNVLNPSMGEIRDKILVQTKQTEKILKTPILCEDEVTEKWAKNLLNCSDVKKKVDVKKVPMGASTLKELATKKHPVFKKMVFCLDGDQNENPKKGNSKMIPRTVFLPGEYFPEKIFYKFLDGLLEEDEFWDNDKYFTKQVCFNGYIEITSTGQYKNWYNEKFKDSATSLLNRWKKDNQDEVTKFHEKVKEALNVISN